MAARNFLMLLAVFCLATVLLQVKWYNLAREDPQRSQIIKWDQETLEDMVQLIREELPSTFKSSQQVPGSVSLGSDAYWALESSRASLRGSVASAQKHLLKIIGQMKREDGWDSDDDPTRVFTRAVIVYMPNLSRDSRQYPRAELGKITIFDLDLLLY